MRDANEVHLIGRAGKNGEVKYTSTGKTLGTFSLATGGGKKKDGSGDWPTDWHACKVWGEAAEFVSEIRKGAWVEVFGRISYGSYEKDGFKRYTTDIVCTKIVLPEEDRSQERRDPVKQAARRDVTEADPITDEDIPF